MLLLFRLSWGHFSLLVCVTQLCPTLCKPMDCSPPGSSVHGILQAWIFTTQGSTQVSCIAGRFFTIWATWTLLMLLVCFSFFSLLFQLLWSFLLESFLKYMVLGYAFIFKNEMLKNCELSCTSGSWSVRELHHMIRKWLPIFVGDW